MPKFCSLRPCYSLRKTIGVFVKGKWRGIPPKFCTEDTYLVIFHRTFDTTKAETNCYRACLYVCRIGTIFDWGQYWIY